MCDTSVLAERFVPALGNTPRKFIGALDAKRSLVKDQSASTPATQLGEN
jgi:hypothetical protein